MVQLLSFVALFILTLGLNNTHSKYPHQTPEISVRK